MTKLLRVTGKTFVCGAILRKDSIWQAVEIAPYLRKIVGNTPIEDWKRLFEQKGYQWEWI